MSVKNEASKESRAEPRPLSAWERLLSKAMRGVKSALEAEGWDAPWAGAEALTEAIRKGDEREFRRLIARGARMDPRPCGKGLSPREIPLREACGERGAGRESFVRLLASAGANLDARFKVHPLTEETGALTEALSSGLWETGLVLMERMKDPLRADSDGRSPLIAAAQGFRGRRHGKTEEEFRAGFVRACEELSRLGVDATARTRDCIERSGGGSALHLANDPLSIGQMVAMGADVNARNSRGETPLMIACENFKAGEREALDGVRALLAAGADALAVDERGDDALSRITRRSPGMRRAWGWSQVSAKEGASLCEALFEAGLHPEKRDERGLRAWELLERPLEMPGMKEALARWEAREINQSLTASAPPQNKASRRI